MELYRQDFAANAARVKQDLEEFGTLSETAEDRGVTAEIGSALENIQQGHGEFWGQADSGKLAAAAETYRTKTNPAIKQAVKVAETFTTQQSAAIVKAIQDTQSDVARARWMMLAMMAFVLLVSTTVVFIVRQINGSLRHAVTELT